MINWPSKDVREGVREERVLPQFLHSGALALQPARLLTQGRRKEERRAVLEEREEKGIWSGGGGSAGDQAERFPEERELGGGKKALRQGGLLPRVRRRRCS